jgi:integrase
MPLTDKEIQGAKPQAKRYKLSDGNGLTLVVYPNGSRYWVYRFQWREKDAELSLGVYPTVTLKAAREHATEARELVDNRIDPREHKRTTKQSSAVLFRDVAEEWLALQSKPNKKTQKAPLSPKTIAKKRWLLDSHIYPAPAPGQPGLGDTPCSEVNSEQLLTTLRKIEASDMHETAHRGRALVSNVMCYAVATGRATSDPAWLLRRALAPVVVTHHAAITNPEKVGDLLLAIDGYHGEFTTQCALKLSPLLMVRPVELREAEWAEFDLDNSQWRIPPERMKMRDPHIVPLNRQAIAILKELKRVTGHQRYLFPSSQTPGEPMSNNTVRKALQLLGYPGDVMTAHGFRTTASTLLNEQGRWHPDAIERQLAHCDHDKTRATYNYAEYLPQRRKMMKAWADYLDKLRNQARARTQQECEKVA